MPKSTTFSNSVLDGVLGSGSPATLTLKLSTVIPTKSVTETSPVSLWTNYADASITNNATNFPAASNGSKTSAVAVDFGTATVTGTQPTLLGWALYNGASRLYFGVITNSSVAPKVFTASSSTDTLTAPGHGLSNGQCVALWADSGSTLPTGLAEGTLYYVINVSGDTFQLSATSGGAAIDITASGAGTVQYVNPQTIANGSTVNIASGAIVITEA